jgi:hypothetical protein
VSDSKISLRISRQRCGRTFYLDGEKLAMANVQFLLQRRIDLKQTNGNLPPACELAISLAAFAAFVSLELLVPGAMATLAVMRKCSKR